MKRIAALDGWRGIAILLVLADHYEFALTGNAHTWLWGTGQHGVTIFFVLSGYLITSKLIQDSNLKRFYMREFFRLMPVAWTYLLFAAGLERLLNLHRPLPGAPGAESGTWDSTNLNRTTIAIYIPPTEPGGGRWRKQVKGMR